MRLLQARRRGAVRRDEPSALPTADERPVPAPAPPEKQRTEEPQAVPPPEPAEVQRLNQLWQQHDEAVPKHDMSETEDLRDLIGGDLHEGFELVRKHWNEARGSDPDRFFRLTVWLDSLAWDADQQHLCRVALETALEELEDRGYRSILCALLAVDAQASDDPRSADAWLARCDPRSDSLTVDSAYRVACAEIGHARADALGVLRALGTTHEAVPFSAYHEAKVKFDFWVARTVHSADVPERRFVVFSLDEPSDHFGDGFVRLVADRLVVRLVLERRHHGCGVTNEHRDIGILNSLRKRFHEEGGLRHVG